MALSWIPPHMCVSRLTLGGRTPGGGRGSSGHHQVCLFPPSPAMIWNIICREIPQFLILDLMQDFQHQPAFFQPLNFFNDEIRTNLQTMAALVQGCKPKGVEEVNANLNLKLKMSQSRVSLLLENGSVARDQLRQMEVAQAYKRQLHESFARVDLRPAWLFLETAEVNERRAKDGVPDEFDDDTNRYKAMRRRMNW